jgi:hypothetical protein
MSSLTDLYDEIKAETAKPVQYTAPLTNNGSLQTSPGATVWRNKAVVECNRLKEDCAKRIVLDIYCKCLPLDSDYVAGNQGQMKQDVDAFLQSKNQTAVQYLTSGFEKTKAPLLEFVLRSINNIGRAFMEEADETLKAAQKDKKAVPVPQADADAEKAQQQLIEIEDDTKYEDFIATMKKKTIDKIVADVSEIINSKKEEEDMSFTLPETTTESTVGIVINHLNHRLMREGVQIDATVSDQIIGLAIREATFNIIDTCFKQPETDLRSFTIKIRFNKGVLVTESVFQNLKKK